jgi:hypothetical protein
VQSGGQSAEQPGGQVGTRQQLNAGAAVWQLAAGRTFALMAVQVPTQAVNPSAASSHRLRVMSVPL